MPLHVLSCMYSHPTGSDDDTTYFAASFTSTNIRNYDLAYLDITVNSSTAKPSADREYGYLERGNDWLFCECPIGKVYVGMYTTVDKGGIMNIN